MDIHEAAGLVQAPTGLRGATPSVTKANIVRWLDKLVLANVQRGTDIFDRDPDGDIVLGSYSGLREGEWNKVIAALGSSEILSWSAAMASHVPRLSCGKIKVTSGSHGRGHSSTAYPRVGPFLS